MNADFEPHFSVKHMLKDMQIANRLGRGFDLDLTAAGATRDRLLDEARQGRGDQDFSSIARRFLPFAEETGAPDLQPDLFSQATPPPEQVVPHEEPEFVERQLAEISATYSVETSPPLTEEAPQPSEPEAKPLPDEAVNYIPIAIEPPFEAAGEAAAPTSAEPELPARSTEEEKTEESRGFLSRLLRRTDY
jgi:hypothetical protein